MALPDPQPGLVIHYSYLWRSEERLGLEEGRKDRPCVVVLAVRKLEDELTVVVAPITHSPPREGEQGLHVEIPAATKNRLGLDASPSYIVTTEVNVFVWPGPDLRPTPPSAGTQFAYGFLPHALMRQVTAHIRANFEKRSAGIVHRT